MSKNDNNGRLTYEQYRLADLIMFTIIMAGCETLNVLAISKWFPTQLYSISIMLTVTLIVLVRWNWWASFFPIVDGVLYCALNGADFSTFAIYIIGNVFVMFAWFLFKAIPKEKVLSKWYWVALYGFIGFLLLLIGRSIVALVCGYSFLDTLSVSVYAESLNGFFAIVVLLLIRKLNGLLCDQKQYLLSIYKENTAIKNTENDKWDGYSELDEDALSRLNRGYDEILPEDEYPPESR